MNKTIPGVKRFFKRNSSTILTCVGAIGVVATAIVSAKDTVKAVKILKEIEEDDVKLTKKEIIKTIAPVYIPTALVGLSTMVCIFGANALNKKTQASLISAYSLLDRSYKEYIDKTKELYGEDSDKRIKEGIAKCHYSDNDAFVKDEGKSIFFDFYGLQFFNSTMEEVLNAEKAINQLLQNSGVVSLSTYYDMLGIQVSDIDYEIGWSQNTCHEYGHDSIVFQYDKIKNDDGSEFYSITMVTPPVEDYMWF